ncbi:hypothetical protein ACFOZ7_16345 [Natribaculum luteum]|uniref:Pyrrolo-quinoline quinone n=1 Tax=Natribaculum luteum TaxID=1586232 RepID=A0ABD5P301_9EURY|nr:hypothetical protein [Natribaculum luteum]
MTIVDRRDFLLTTAGAVTIGSVAGRVVGTESKTKTKPTETDRQWEWRRSDDGFSSVSDVRCVDDGFLLVGTVRDLPSPARGFATKLTRDGTVEWERQYASADQREALEEDVIGPIPEDGFAFALPADGGYLLVGWTYYDNTAVYVGRLVRVDGDGRVEWERSFFDLEDASGYSYLADGVVTEDGFLLCGIESPGILLGGGGWLVSVATDGSINWFRRIPATERDLAETARQDVFTGIVPTVGGYVLSGHYEPELGDERAWVVGVDDQGAVRWQDQFALETAGPTRATDVEPNETDTREDVLVVGSVGPRLDARDFQTFPAQTLEGDGFVVGYTAGGDRQWLEERADTPLFGATRTPRGVVAGGARNGRGWVGTLGRTFFEADFRSVVTSLCDDEDDGLVAAGRRFDDDDADAWARSIDESRKRHSGKSDDDADDRSEERTVEYLDCETVRVTGAFADVLLHVVWWTEADEATVGTISEPVGGVDGERTISASEAFGSFEYGPIVEATEVFEAGTSVVPGSGDLVVENPDAGACRGAVLEQFDGG